LKKAFIIVDDFFPPFANQSQIYLIEISVADFCTKPKTIFKTSLGRISKDAQSTFIAGFHMKSSRQFHTHNCLQHPAGVVQKEQIL
jgi:hypothetical protein